MTQRQRKLARAALNYLHDLDGGQACDVLVHAGVNEILGEYVPLAEMDEVLELMDRQGWIITVKSKLKGTLRSLSDLGEAARMEMRTQS
jgi:hypothetical protein